MPPSVPNNARGAKKRRRPTGTLSLLLSRIRNAARKKRKDTAFRKSPAYQLLQQKRRQAEAERAEALAAEETAERLTLLKPPSWWNELWAENTERREQTSLRVEGGQDAFGMVSHDDTSVYRIAVVPTSLTAVEVQWTFPPGNPGHSGAWVGLFACEDGIHDPRLRLRYKLITRDSRRGCLSFSESHFEGIADGEHVFVLMGDYGVQHRALSQRVWLLGGRIVMMDAEPGAVTLSDALSPGTRSARHFSLTRGRLAGDAGSDDDDVQDERCFFPVPLVDVVLLKEREGDYYSTRVKHLYQLADKLSFLDWGLSSDYESVADDRRDPRKPLAPSLDNEVYVPAGLQRAMRQSKQTGLGGGTHGSEGYGEATIGSVQKLIVLLQNLRQLVLGKLCPPDMQWSGSVHAVPGSGALDLTGTRPRPTLPPRNALYDLGQLSTFLDVGSGYGKVIVHAKLEASPRRCVGVECVISRHNIAEKMLQTLRDELDDEASRSAEKALQCREPRPRSPRFTASKDEEDQVRRWGMPACVKVSSLDMPFTKAPDIYRGIEFRCARRP